MQLTPILRIYLTEAMETKRRQNGAWPRAPALETRAPALETRAPAHLLCPIRVNFADRAPPTLGIKENREINVGLIRRPRFI